jgi:hypothetical protein
MIRESPFGNHYSAYTYYIWMVQSTGQLRVHVFIAGISLLSFQRTWIIVISNCKRSLCRRVTLRTSCISVPLTVRQLLRPKSKACSLHSLIHTFYACKELRTSFIFVIICGEKKRLVVNSHTTMHLHFNGGKGTVIPDFNWLSTTPWRCAWDMCESQTRSRCCGEVKFYSCRESNVRRPTRSPSLYQLSYTKSTKMFR